MTYTKALATKFIICTPLPPSTDDKELLIMSSLSCQYKTEVLIVPLLNVYLLHISITYFLLNFIINNLQWPCSTEEHVLQPYNYLKPSNKHIADSNNDP